MLTGGVQGVWRRKREREDIGSVVLVLVKIT
jgi:hypothetical protein